MGQLFPALERRTWQLFECLERRQKEGGGYLNIGDAFYHWSHDFMVRLSPIPFKCVCRNLNYDGQGDMVFSGCNEFVSAIIAPVAVYTGDLRHSLAHRNS